ncbi:MAG: response regulator [Campylobacterota bacterium]|nr:response regulator [Campylobacterota bacterium]
MLNVMVVDDSIMIRRILSKKLEEMGHTVVAQAKSGQEAVSMYEEYKPDLVTMDITMPLMNGIEALSKIKAEFNEANIVMVTSHGEEELVMDAISKGTKGYILKPINSEKIATVISKIFK